jgi:vacuolar-type H+-ATPase subunit E/Vma4
MSSIEELRRKMIEDARKRAEDIIREAETKAQEIIEKGEKEWLEKTRVEKERIMADAERKAAITISEARRKARLIIVEKKNELIEQIYNDAWMKIKNREGFDVEKSLRNLLKESLIYIEEPKIIIVNTTDENTMHRILEEKHIENIKVQGSTSVTGGLIVVSVKDERVDNTYDTRFKRAKDVLRPVIAGILWG